MGHSKTTKENSTKWEEMTLKYANKRMQEKPKDFGLKQGNQESITKEPNE